MTRRIIVSVAFVLVVLILGLAARRYANADWLMTHELDLRNTIDAHPIQSWFCGLAVYTLLSLIPGTGGKSIACGWMFGLTGGVLMVEIGLTAAAAIEFSVSRKWLRESVSRVWGRRATHLARRIEANAAVLMLTLRFAHAPYTLTNFVAGTTKIPLRTFWWTTQLGVLPGTIIFVFAGTQIPTLSDVATQGVWTVIDHRMVLAFAAVALVPWTIKLLLQRFFKPLRTSLPTPPSQLA